METEKTIDVIDIYTSKRKYNLIIADPPWQYYTNGYKGGTKNHYKTMSLTEICALPVENLAAKNCTLFLWSTAPMMPKALQVAEAWGFEYKTVFFNWIKTTKDKKTPTRRVTGWYTRNCVEYLLVATKGNMDQYADKSINVSSVFYEYAARHSEKPDYPMRQIVKIFGNLPRIELFARKIMYGWDCWGDQIVAQNDTQYDLQKKNKSLQKMHESQDENVLSRPKEVKEN